MMANKASSKALLKFRSFFFPSADEQEKEFGGICINKNTTRNGKARK